tara:strand:- start:196 stop:1503 length:1308 start_codon:yes stop_codon:yes gene_type:complete
MNNFFISFNETIHLIFLTFILVLPFNLFNKNNKLTFAHPLIFYSIVMFYYTVFSPFFQIIANETASKGLDFRALYTLGWKGAILSATSILVGYSLKIKFIKNQSRKCVLNFNSLWSIGLILNIIGITFYMIIRGFDLSVFNPFYNKSLSIDFLVYKGTFRNYFLYAQEFLVGGNLLMFASTYETKRKFILTSINILISFLLFLNSGFRFRVLFLITSLILYFIIREEKLKNNLAITIGASTIIFVTIFMVFIGEIRTYGVGFNFELENIYSQNLFKTGESDIFITSSGAINLIPENFSFQGFYPIFKALMHPLPSTLFDKNAGDYLFKIIDGVYDYKDIYYGAAYLNYAEYYIMFGWFGISIFSFLLGHLFKRLWYWINQRKEEPLALIVYLLNVSFIFMIVSRGYLPQQLQLYSFTVLPIYVVYLSNLKKTLNN